MPAANPAGRRVASRRPTPLVRRLPAASMPGVTRTRELLLRWHEGDAGAMAELVEQELPFVRREVHKRLGPRLRRHHDTDDIVQATLLQALRSAPRFLVSDRDKLRGLLVRMTENALRVQANHAVRQKRDLRREVPMPASSGTALDLDAAASSTGPEQAAERNEVRDWVRLALELLAPEDRIVILRRDYDERSFAEIAAELGTTEDAVRMRHRRARPRLAATLLRLRRGDVDDACGAAVENPSDPGA